MNMADHFSKQLPPTLFARHVDHILGHVPPPYSPQYHLIAGTLNNPSINTLRISSASHTIISDNDDIDFSSVDYVKQTNKLVSDWALIVYHRPR
jgi:hypothetical protein